MRRIIMTSTIIRTVALIGASAVLSSPSNAITAELAKKCKVLTDAAFPLREPGNPAAGSAKGSGRDATTYFNKCVANNGKVEGGNEQTTGGPAAPTK